MSRGKHRGADPTEWSDAEIKDWIGELHSGVRSELEAVAVTDTGIRNRYFEKLPEPTLVTPETAQWDVNLEGHGLRHVVVLDLSNGNVVLYLLNAERRFNVTDIPRELAAALLAADAYRRKT